MPNQFNDDDDFKFWRTRNGDFACRIRAGRNPANGKSRQLRVTVATDDETIFRARVRRLREVSAALTAGGMPREAAVAIKKAAEQRDEVRFELCCTAALELAPVIKATPTGSWHTFGELARAWWDGSLHRKWPDLVTKKEDSSKDKAKLEYLCALVVEQASRRTLGSLPLANVTFEHASAAMAQLPPDCKRPAARRHYAQVIGRVLKLAAFPVAAIVASPLPRNWLPKIVKGDILYQHLYPDEDLQLMRCELVPLAWRILFGLCNREGARIDEFLSRLSWRGIDERRGKISVGKRKNGRPGRWNAEPGSIVALMLLSNDLEGPFADLPNDGQWAKRLQESMRLARLDRAALYDTNIDKGFQRMRAHDTRATYVTIALACGLSEGHIMLRTGHSSSEMIHRYDHAKQALVEDDLPGGAHLVPLDEALGLAPPAGRRVGWMTRPLEPGDARLVGIAERLAGDGARWARRGAEPGEVEGDELEAQSAGAVQGPERSPSGELDLEHGAAVEVNADRPNASRPVTAGAGCAPEAAPATVASRASSGRPGRASRVESEPGAAYVVTVAAGAVEPPGGAGDGRRPRASSPPRGSRTGRGGGGSGGESPGESFSGASSGVALAPDRGSSVKHAGAASSWPLRESNPDAHGRGILSRSGGPPEAPRDGLKPRLLVAGDAGNGQTDSPDRVQASRSGMVLVALRRAAHEAVERGDTGALGTLMAAVAACTAGGELDAAALRLAAHVAIERGDMEGAQALMLAMADAQRATRGVA